MSELHLHCCGCPLLPATCCLPACLPADGCGLSDGQVWGGQGRHSGPAGAASGESVRIAAAAADADADCRCRCPPLTRLLPCAVSAAFLSFSAGQGGSLCLHGGSLLRAPGLVRPGGTHCQVPGVGSAGAEIVVGQRWESPAQERKVERSDSLFCFASLLSVHCVLASPLPHPPVHPRVCRACPPAEPGSTRGAPRDSGPV